MCLLLLAYEVHPAYRLVLAANRDEFYARPTAPLTFWEDAPDILAGRDLQGGGTWLGVTRSGRIAAVTNYREPGSRQQGAPSRGFLVRDFLTGQESPTQYLQQVQSQQQAYNGFNLIVGDFSDILSMSDVSNVSDIAGPRLCYLSNRGGEIKELETGLYGLSNHLLDTPWPKVEKGKAELRSLLVGDGSVTPDDILQILQDRTRPPDDALPDTGVGQELERILSSLFITSPVYGTRSASVILIQADRGLTFVEYTFEPGGEVDKAADTREFVIPLPSEAD